MKLPMALFLHNEVQAKSSVDTDSIPNIDKTSFQSLCQSFVCRCKTLEVIVPTIQLPCKSSCITGNHGFLLLCLPRWTNHKLIPKKSLINRFADLSLSSSLRKLHLTYLMTVISVRSLWSAIRLMILSIILALESGASVSLSSTTCHQIWQVMKSG